MPQSKSSLRYLLLPRGRRDTASVGDEFPREDAFDEDYLYFYEELLTPERTAADVELVWRLLELSPGLELLDLACGHGRIANALAERGVRVTGLDATPLFLDLARADAAERGLDVEYVEGDMRSIPWRERFDRVLCWFTSFGYFDDPDNQKTLAEFARVLRPGGQLLLETMHHDGFVRGFIPAPGATVAERGDDTLIDVTTFDSVRGRVETDRTVHRDGRVRRSHHSIRVPTVPEFDEWLAAAGFSERHYSERGGRPLRYDSRRLVVTATK